VKEFFNGINLILDAAARPGFAVTRQTC
jgi:hypothetical protein